MESNSLEPNVLGFCKPFNDPYKFVTMMVTCLLVQIVYLIAFIIGLRNIWLVLIKQKFYRSVTMSWQYVLG